MICRGGDLDDLLVTILLVASLPGGKTTSYLRRDLLSKTPNCYVRPGEFRGYSFTGNARQKYAKRNGIGAGNSAN